MLPSMESVLPRFGLFRLGPRLFEFLRTTSKSNIMVWPSSTTTRDPWPSSWLKPRLVNLNGRSLWTIMSRSMVLSFIIMMLHDVVAQDWIRFDRSGHLPLSVLLVINCLILLVLLLSQGHGLQLLDAVGAVTEPWSDQTRKDSFKSLQLLLHPPYEKYSRFRVARFYHVWVPYARNWWKWDV